MATERPPLRLVTTPPAESTPPVLGVLETALRLAGADRGALVRRSAGTTQVTVTACRLSSEEEAACQEMARRLWRRSARAAQTSRLGDGTLIAQPLAGGDPRAESSVLVAVLRGGAGKVDTERLAALHDAGVLLGAVAAAASAEERATRAAVEERRRAEWMLALNQALHTLADTDDVSAACEALLAQLLPQFPGVDYGTVWLLETGGERLRRVADRGHQASAELAAFIPLRSGYAVDAVVETGESRVVEFGRGRARTPSERMARATGTVSLLQVPLRSRTMVTGVLILGARRHHEFSIEERAFLEMLGGQLGGRLDAVRELEAAEAERERLRAVIDTLPVGIVLYDAAGRVSLWNSAVEGLLGRPADVDVAHQRGLPPLLTPDGRQLPADESPVLRAVRDGGIEAGRELGLRRAGRDGGRDVPVLVNAAPIRDAQGRVSGAIAVYQDITPLREVDRLKDEFINTVSHELRTPTTTVRGGALTLLRRGEQLEPGVRRQLLQDMADEAERLYHLVEDLLSLSRAEAGMRLQPEPIIPHRFIQKVIFELGGRVGNHSLSVDVPENLPLIEADPSHLDQVLRNLLGNAVKFSPKGRRIEVTARAKGKPPTEVVFSVLDEGSGIPAADMDRVFEPFYRTEEAKNAGQQGAGLGLAAARRLIEIQGGRIWAERRRGGGTAFRFTLPALNDVPE